MISKREVKKTIDAIESALRLGHSPQGIMAVGGAISALAAASAALGITTQSIYSRLETIKKHYALEPRWELWNVPEPPAVHAEPLPTSDPPTPTQPPPTVSERVLASLRDENANLRKQLKEAHLEMFGWDEIREHVLGLSKQDLSPEIILPKVTNKKGARTVIVHLSDLHCGEVVELDEMGGLNEYNIHIFDARMGRLVAKVTELLTTHWKGDPPERMVVILGGDMVNGEIHDEYAKTNDALAAPAVRISAVRIAGAIREFAKIAPIEVISIPGNHDRLTHKIESKGFAKNSLATLVCAIVEMLLADQGDRIKFHTPMSGDMVVKIYHVTFGIIHGQREIKGGQGFIGPFAAILRGWQRVHAYFAAQGRPLDIVLSGHLHVSGFIPSFGAANGSLVGPSDYSRDLRAKPEPASQNMIVCHSEVGVISVQQILVGHEDEGSIYRTHSREPVPRNAEIGA